MLEDLKPQNRQATLPSDLMCRLTWVSREPLEVVEFELRKIWEMGGERFGGPLLESRLAHGAREGSFVGVNPGVVVEGRSLGKLLSTGRE